jgi:hypothetical protein
MILDGIISTTMQTFGNVSPSIARAILLTLEDDTIFLLGPWGLGDVRIQMVVPSFSALFANPSCVGC